jgi:hypothetical protein
MKFIKRIIDLLKNHKHPVSLKTFWACEFGGGGGEQQPAMVGGTQTTVQKADPWEGQQPYLKTGFAEAQKRMLDFTPTYFPGNTVVPYSPETQAAMDLTAQRAISGSPITSASRDELTRTLSGDYLYGNPGYDRAVQAAMDKAMPGINSQFALAGRYGSGLNQEAMARAFGDAFADQYANERTNQMRAMMFAPQVAESEYSDFGKLASVGAQKEAMQQELLADQIARHDFAQSVKARQLQLYMDAIQGNYGNTTTSTGPAMQQPTYYRNQGAGFLGGAMQGASLASTLGFGGMGMGVGGLLGGLLGGFF